MNATAAPWGGIGIGVGVGVFWAAWGYYGFWWGLVYGLAWPIWLGYRLAEYLLR